MAIWQFFYPLQAGRSRSRQRRKPRSKAMSKLLVKTKAGNGRVAHVTPRKRRLDLCRLRPAPAEAGRDASRQRPADREVCLVFVTGKATVSAGGKDFGLLGERMIALRGQAVVGLCAGGVGLDGDRRHRSRARGLLGAGPRRRPAGARHRAGRSRPGDARQGHQHALRHQHPARRTSRRIRCWWSR